MCRIAGIVSNKLNPDEICAKVKIMCKALEHGGPDDEGIFSNDNGHLVFGHRRLSIIDLTPNGHQPMADVQQKVWITFNGEIYNFPDLKQQLLSLGAVFHSHTDTEVIIQAYIHWGMAAFSKLRGIFAFALYDITKNVTYLVRDSSGIKPLYYHIGNEQLSFASEVKALKEAGVATTTDPTWKVRFLAYGHVPEPYTTLKNVYSLPKGHFLCWRHGDATHEVHSYHVFSNRKWITNTDEARHTVRTSLLNAVNRQLIADAPIGVFLSGGVDSSLLTLLANEQKKTQLKTISIFFDEKAYDERMYQNLVTQKIEGEKFAHLVKQRDFEELLPQILEDMDMPTTDGINSWFISKYAHDDGLKAVLSGVGADELFGGYPSFNRIQYLKSFRKVPAGIFNSAKYFTSDRYKKISYLAYNHPLADYLFLRGHHAPAEIAEILDMDLHEVEDILFSDKQLPSTGNYNEENAAWFEMNIYMQNQLLRDADVMGMSHALEIRVPFLDEDFKYKVESIAAGIRFNKHQSKKLLIDSFIEVLPRAVWNRAKMGFTFPLQQWMRHYDKISNPDLYRGKKAKNIIKNFGNNTMHWSKVFALYQIQQHE